MSYIASDGYTATSFQTQVEDDEDMDVGERDTDETGFIDAVIEKSKREYEEEQEQLNRRSYLD
jgi:hypothetical protein